MKKFVCSFVLICSVCFSLTAQASGWVLDKAHSTVSFSILQFGGMVHGKFEDYDTNIRFDAEKPESAVFELDVLMSSVMTGIDAVDSTLHERDWLDVYQYPQAHFKTTAVEVTDSGYRLTGDFRLKSTTKRIVFPMQWQQQGDQAVVLSALEINRLDYGIGVGEDAAEGQVGEVIEIRVKFELTKSTAH